MGLQRPQRHEIARAALAAKESTNLEQVVEKPVPEEPVQSIQEQVQAEPKKVGRPKKEKKPRSAKQLANDERQRQRFKLIIRRPPAASAILKLRAWSPGSSSCH